MSGAIVALLAIIAQIAPSIGVPEVIVSIITTLENIVPFVVKEVQDAVPIIKNIIDALRNNDTVTEDQWTQLDVLEERLDAEFEAAVAQPGPEGMPQ